MFPLVPSIKFVSFLYCVFAFSKIYKSWQKDKENQLLGVFLKFFGWLGLTLLVFSLPLVFENLAVLQISFYLIEFFSFLAAGYLALLVLDLTYFRKLKRLFFGLMILIGLTIALVGALNYQPAHLYFYQFAGIDFVGWWPSSPKFLQLTDGVFVAGAALFSAFLFFIKGLVSQDKFVKNRSFIFALGILNLAVASGTYYIVGALSPMSFFKDLLHSATVVSGLAFLLAGVYYKKQIVQTPND